MTPLPKVKQKNMSQPYDRVFNFSAGPCTLPVSVLESARDGLLNYKESGMSVMEMSHRSKAYEKIHSEAESDLRSLLNIPSDYKVLFLQGGASLQFTMLAMSFLQGGSADYVITGAWGKKALEAALLEGSAVKIFDAKDTNYNRIPKFADLNFSPDARYVHFTSNETIQGVEFKADPKTAAPLFCDMSSDILSRPVEISNYSLIYAGAQKNMGPAGLAVVIIKESLIATAPEKLHAMLDYRVHAENGSLYNTPPCWSIYICGLVYKNLLANGGVAAAQKICEKRSGLLYDAIDQSGGFFKGHAQVDCRSTMNVTFTLPSEDLTAKFLKEAQCLNLDGLKGHRSVGGCRASIYNAFPVEGCEVLASFMKEFASRNG